MIVIEENDMDIFFQYCDITEVIVHQEKAEVVSVVDEFEEIEEDDESDESDESDDSAEEPEVGDEPLAVA